ncbi:MAG: CoB--CoM heterodisulfide reductase iron-sulfur subunit B family protein [Chloroflexota bacterium]|nr:CoB--CoM heterodisulfide reductase iron-sulfur subunit B family protein [Chloroflexota bacterium]
MKYAYYPGCSLESTAKEYDDSVREVCRILGVDLEELENWVCCGASSAHSSNQLLSHVLPGRDLAVAERDGLDIMAPCPACFLRLKVTRHKVMQDSGLRSQVEEAIGLAYTAKCDVKNILDVIYTDIGVESIREKVKKPLGGMKLVSYYGCYFVRPPDVVCFDDPENPRSMDEILTALGADALDWAGKVDCCGASLSLSRKDIVIDLVGKVVGSAREVGAEGIVCACPLCQVNLDTRQADEALPVFYLTELMGLAMGAQKTNSWFGKHIVSPLKLLRSYALI